MRPLRLALAGLAATSALNAPAASADELCDAVDALILSGQQDVSWEDLFKPRPNELRNDNVYPASPLLGLFTVCNVKDDVDAVERSNTVLYCYADETDGTTVTEASRAEFIANEFARFQAISACIAAKPGWGSYGNAAEGRFNAFLESEAQTRLEDAMSAEMAAVQLGIPPLYRVRLSLQLRTTPRDYR
jgi:hypothetical protein